MEAMGIRCIEVGPYFSDGEVDNGELDVPLFESEDVQEALRIILDE